ncbi:site-specific integrase [Bacillus licheniformis]|uniref:site-specific integrase n=1 Tax=Bacillus subtilis group TaxID=653685 RepID=UPI0011A569F6|nr:MULTISPECIES: site-specific integrase [Bacillus subtilis group]MBU8800380.1 site-specific integrase [Bacillus licheniformis]MED1079502.1 site-specific integrase [Bacillus licheniformis]QEO06647.1 site-specific integrase [Bacillus paralicheniformis]TWK17367.1 Tyrosine recombinase XerC [Bacillus licheniformis]GIN35124.1 site-specific integrase [Bacillus licheniformis]
MASFQQYKTKTGYKWLFKMGVGIDPKTGNRKTTTRRGFKTKKEAVAAAAEFQKEIDNNALDRNDITFEDVFKEWWDVHSKTIKRSTRYRKLSNFKKHILPHFGKLKIKNITRAYCQKVINLIAQDIDSVQNVKIQANLVFKYALRMEYITKNPMEFVVIPKKEENFLSQEEEKRNFWEKDEIKTFLEKAHSQLAPQDYVMFYVLIFTGMRKGELIALEWKDVDLKEKTINIKQTMFFENGKEVIQTTKKYHSKRIITIDDQTAQILKKWRTQQKEMLLSNGITSEAKYVLIRDDMRPLRLAYPNDLLNRMIAKNKLHRITIHGFRHSHASILFEAGASIKEVQARLGHKEIQTTMNIYTHVTKTAKEKTAETFKKYMEL